MTNYLLLALVAAWFAYRFISSAMAKRRLPEILQQGAQIVDVRSPAEFSQGHARGSRNIPLPEIGARARELDRSRWVVVCCASGTRSGMAARVLKREGFTQVLNAGTWRNLP